MGDVTVKGSVWKSGNSPSPEKVRPVPSSTGEERSRAAGCAFSCAAGVASPLSLRQRAARPLRLHDLCPTELAVVTKKRAELWTRLNGGRLHLSVKLASPGGWIRPPRILPVPNPTTFLRPHTRRFFLPRGLLAELRARPECYVVQPRSLRSHGAHEWLRRRRAEFLPRRD